MNGSSLMFQISNSLEQKLNTHSLSVLAIVLSCRTELVLYLKFVKKIYGAIKNFAESCTDKKYMQFRKLIYFETSESKNT